VAQRVEAVPERPTTVEESGVCVQVDGVHVWREDRNTFLFFYTIQ
jgi:hypothetical protein